MEKEYHTFKTSRREREKKKRQVERDITQIIELLYFGHGDDAAAKLLHDTLDWVAFDKNAWGPVFSAYSIQSWLTDVA